MEATDLVDGWRGQPWRESSLGDVGVETFLAAAALEMDLRDVALGIGRHLHDHLVAVACLRGSGRPVAWGIHVRARTAVGERKFLQPVPAASINNAQREEKTRGRFMIRNAHVKTVRRQEVQTFRCRRTSDSGEFCGRGRLAFFRQDFQLGFLVDDERIRRHAPREEDIAADGTARADDACPRRAR